MKISSDKITINGLPQKAYNRVSNFSDLGGMMPPQVQDWKATQDTCSFTAGGMPVSMRIAQRIEPTSVIIASEEGSPFKFALAFTFTPDNGNPYLFTSQVEAEIDINPIMGAMMKPQMRKLVDTLNQQIKHYCEL